MNNSQDKIKEKNDKLLLKEHKEKELINDNIINKVKKKEKEIPDIEIIKLLTGINLKVEKGDLVGIVGTVGAGKTLLLNAILNNLDVLIIFK